MTNSRNSQQGPSFSLKSVDHVGISVADLDRSVPFYEALTGIAPAVRDETIEGPGFARGAGLPVTKLRYATFHLTNLNLDVIEFQEPRGEPVPATANRPGSMHLCFEVENLADVYARMRQAGVEFLGEPYRFADEEVSAKDAVGTEVAYFNDPDGNNLELITPRGGFVRGG
ncbi:VOC family protein [Micromonospora sp. NPDC049559]|uniref:VOC family protein n=1 Tax=Micromonospora sp. NPDC049559 TaxID=3155923 RepID=UPI00343EA53D